MIITAWFTTIYTHQWLNNKTKTIIKLFILFYFFNKFSWVLLTCFADGEGDILMDPLMVDWFNLIRKKQMFIRKESELVYMWVLLKDRCRLRILNDPFSIIWGIITHLDNICLHQKRLLNNTLTWLCDLIVGFLFIYLIILIPNLIYCTWYFL